jgi:hypothetical protein
LCAEKGDFGRLFCFPVGATLVAITSSCRSGSAAINETKEQCPKRRKRTALAQHDHFRNAVSRQSRSYKMIATSVAPTGHEFATIAS